MAKSKIKEDVSTEEKIKNAARKLFTEKGFAAVKTRDIAEEAGLNLALLNYYFRSKENLFDIIMIENFHKFIEQMIPLMSNEKMPLEEVLVQVTSSYIDMLKSNPDLPFFIMNQMRIDAPKLNEVRAKMVNVRAAFLKRIEDKILKKKLSRATNGHMMMNFMGLIIFPFVAQPLLMRVNNYSQKEFDALMDERKRLVPLWLKTIMTVE
jgi:AcrR family transcriptional regulator